MKKGNKRLLVIIALLLLAIICYSTYAIYKTSVSGDVNVTTAVWDVTFKDGATELTTTMNLTLSGSDCSNTHVAPGKIAPGATCTKTITIDGTNTEVDFTYSASVDSANITATKGGNPVSIAGANEFTASLSPSNGTIAYNAASKTATLTLTVSWAGSSTDSDSTNNADTALNGATITVPVTLTASQVVGA